MLALVNSLRFRFLVPLGVESSSTLRQVRQVPGSPVLGDWPLMNVRHRVTSTGRLQPQAVRKTRIALGQRPRTDKLARGEGVPPTCRSTSTRTSAVSGAHTLSTRCASSSSDSAGERKSTLRTDGHCSSSTAAPGASRRKRPALMPSSSPAALSARRKCRAPTVPVNNRCSVESKGRRSRASTRSRCKTARRNCR